MTDRLTEEESVTAVVDTRRGRDLLDPDLFEVLVARVCTEHHDMDRAVAMRVVDQAAAFIATAAADPGRRLTPSPLIDLAWHEFLLRTKDYRAFCASVGAFVDHVPDDPAESTSGGTGPSGAVARTIEAITAAGYTVDPELWSLTARCTSCHEEGGCSSGGEDGTENTETRKKGP
ncbi:hypothetical protein [Alloactinosynnema sp. L-07]|nr:hypothetical protein [Alloactinosynnema sp. L-07]